MDSVVVVVFVFVVELFFVAAVFFVDPYNMQLPVIVLSLSSSFYFDILFDCLGMITSCLVIISYVILVYIFAMFFEN